MKCMLCVQFLVLVLVWCLLLMMWFCQIRFGCLSVGSSVWQCWILVRKVGYLYLVLVMQRCVLSDLFVLVQVLVWLMIQLLLVMMVGLVVMQFLNSVGLVYIVQSVKSFFKELLVSMWWVGLVWYLCFMNGMIWCFSVVRNLLVWLELLFCGSRCIGDSFQVCNWLQFRLLLV